MVGSRPAAVALLLVPVAVGLVACAPQSTRTLRPQVSVTTVVTQPGASTTSILTVSRPEEFLGESMGFTPDESECVTAAMAEADYPDFWLYGAPNEPTKQAILGFMRDCLIDSQSHVPTPTAGTP